MNLLRRLTIAERLAGIAGVASAVVAAGAFVPGALRDPHDLVIDQQGQLLAIALTSLPALFAGLWASANGSLRGRIVTLAALACILYAHTTYAFISYLGPLTVVDIAIVSLGAWSVSGLLPALDDAEIEAAFGGRIPRRTVGTFLIVAASAFGLLWLGQIAGSVTSGTRPADLVEYGWPTSPVYVIDLAFSLPIAALAGGRLLTHRAGGARFALPYLVFLPLYAFQILGEVALSTLDGQAIAAPMIVIFGLLLAIGSALSLAILGPRPHVAAAELATATV